MRPQPFARAAASKRAQASQAILACVDGSIYQASVCDHAAWFLPRTHDGIELLYTSPEADVHPEDVLENASARLHENGAQAHASRSIEDALPMSIARMAAPSDVVVIGRAGSGRPAARREITREVTELIQLTQCAVCVTPRIFLPINRGLVLTASGIGDEAFADALATCPWLDGLSVTIGSLPPADRDGRTEKSCVTEPTLKAWSAGSSDLVILSRKHFHGTGSMRLNPAIRRVLSSRLPLLVI